MATELDKADIVRIIRESQPNVQSIYLFGSFAIGDPWPSSDVDIAILLSRDESKSFNFDAYAKLNGALHEVCGREVDLVNLRSVSTVFQHEIIFNSEVLYCGDANARDEFEMITMSMYQKLNEERAEILGDYARTGGFYGK